MGTQLDPTRWPDFTAAEICCSHCGELYVDPDALSAIQRMRDTLGEPLTLNSAHRCAVHNAEVGGKPNSMHLKLAFDVALEKHDPWAFFTAALKAGFTGIGFDRQYLHLDLGPTRRWHYTPVAAEFWSKVITGGLP